MRTTAYARWGFGIAAAALTAAMPALAQEAERQGPVSIEAEYVHDLVGVVQGASSGIQHTDLFTLSADAALEELAGWSGARIHLSAIAQTGQQPNDLAGTLQGINNVEVPANRVRLFEAWLEQDIPAIRGSLRIGFSDLNSEFYSNDAAGLLLAPAFGIGSELSATGSNGPAIYPSTAMTLRLRAEPGAGSYVQFAAINAESGVLGDQGGVRPLLRSGALLIGEAGITGRMKFAIGAWTYTRLQDDIRLTVPTGDPAASRARGAYLLVEAPVFSDRLTGFVRAGISDGDTTPFAGGWQAGLLASGVIPGRPDSQISLGVNQAVLSSKYRANAADAGEELRAAETAIELTYADKLAPWLTVQPDVQYVWNASRAAESRNALVFTLRLTAGFGWP